MAQKKRKTGIKTLIDKKRRADIVNIILGFDSSSELSLIELATEETIDLRKWVKRMADVFKKEDMVAYDNLYNNLLNNY